MAIFNEMMSQYSLMTELERQNALHEVMQQVTLAGLYRGGFFEKAAFYGGTCLRIFHGLERFSEDMDFSLLTKDDNFKLEDYFHAIVDEFKLLGREVEIRKKEKKHFSRVESAFLKDTTEVWDVSLRTDSTTKIKIEIDTDPPLEFATEQKLLLQPFSFMTRCFTLPDLFAGKMHALVFRNWKNRVKGRDWYDFEWYVRKGVPLDFKHLQERIKEFNGVWMSADEFIVRLKEKLASTDIEMVKRDVYSFVKRPEDVEIWSNDYFLQLADMIKFK